MHLVVDCGRHLPAALLLPVLLTAQPSRRAERYEWAGTCPGECCRYNVDWIATAETRAWPEPRPETSRTPDQRPVFTIRPGDVVRALTGNLYSLEPGVAEMRDDFSTDATYGDFSERHRQTVTFDAGEHVTLLAHLRGDLYRIVHDEVPIDANLHAVGTAAACGQRRTPCAGIITRMPVTRWWAMVMNENQGVGWVQEPSERFRMPPCVGGNGSARRFLHREAPERPEVFTDAPVPPVPPCRVTPVSPRTQLDGAPSFCTAVFGEWRS